MRHLAVFTAAAVLAGCASEPMGPTAKVMPAPGKPFEVFAQDQAACKDFANGQTNGGATIANLKQFGTAAVSTALGGGLGAALSGGRGAQIGGAMGGVAGGGLAGRGSSVDQKGLQSQYDLAYSQCMYAHGNQVAGAAPTAPAGQYGIASAYPLPGALGGGGPAPGLPVPPRAFYQPGEISSR